MNQAIDNLTSTGSFVLELTLLSLAQPYDYHLALAPGLKDAYVGLTHEVSALSSEGTIQRDNKRRLAYGFGASTVLWPEQADVRLNDWCESVKACFASATQHQQSASSFNVSTPAYESRESWFENRYTMAISPSDRGTASHFLFWNGDLGPHLPTLVDSGVNIEKILSEFSTLTAETTDDNLNVEAYFQLVDKLEARWVLFHLSHPHWESHPALFAIIGRDRNQLTSEILEQTQLPSKCVNAIEHLSLGYREDSCIEYTETSIASFFIRWR